MADGLADKLLSMADLAEVVEFVIAQARQARPIKEAARRLVFTAIIQSKTPPNRPCRVHILSVTFPHLFRLYFHSLPEPQRCPVPNLHAV